MQKNSTSVNEVRVVTTTKLQSFISKLKVCFKIMTSKKCFAISEAENKQIGKYDFHAFNFSVEELNKAACDIYTKTFTVMDHQLVSKEIIDNLVEKGRE